MTILAIPTQYDTKDMSEELLAMIHHQMTYHEIKALPTTDVVFSRIQRANGSDLKLTVVLHPFIRIDIPINEKDLASLALDMKWEKPPFKKLKFTRHWFGQKGIKENGPAKGEWYYRLEVILWTDGKQVFTVRGFLDRQQANFIKHLAEPDLDQYFTDNTIHRTEIRDPNGTRTKAC